MSLTIELLTNPSGDYEVVLFDGTVDEHGHNLPSIYWISILKSFGFNAKHREISD